MCIRDSFTNAAVAVLSVPQFTELNEDSWLHHTQDILLGVGGREAVMRRHIAALGVSSRDFSDLIDRIAEEHTVEVDVLKAAVDMHLESCAEGPQVEPCSSYYT